MASSWPRSPSSQTGAAGPNWPPNANIGRATLGTVRLPKSQPPESLEPPRGQHARAPRVRCCVTGCHGLAHCWRPGPSAATNRDAHRLAHAPRRRRRCIDSHRRQNWPPRRTNGDRCRRPNSKPRSMPSSSAMTPTRYSSTVPPPAAATSDWATRTTPPALARCGAGFSAPTPNCSNPDLTRFLGGCAEDLRDLRQAPLRTMGVIERGDVIAVHRGRAECPTAWTRWPRLQRYFINVLIVDEPARGSRRPHLTERRFGTLPASSPASGTATARPPTAGIAGGDVVPAPAGGRLDRTVMPADLCANLCVTSVGIPGHRASAADRPQPRSDPASAGRVRPRRIGDVDHTIPDGAGGLQRPRSLKCSAGQHHLLKTFWTGKSGWTDRQESDGTVIWTSPTDTNTRSLLAAASTSRNGTPPPPPPRAHQRPRAHHPSTAA